MHRLFVLLIFILSNLNLCKLFGGYFYLATLYIKIAGLWVKGQLLDGVGGQGQLLDLQRLLPCHFSVKKFESCTDESFTHLRSSKF